MLSQSSRRLSFFLKSPLLRSSGTAKPGWHVSKGQRWGPELPDNQYYWDHPTYTGFVLWLREMRPYIEKLATDGFKTAKSIIVNWAVKPVTNVIVRHNPDFRLRVVAFGSFYLTAQSINMSFNRYYQKLMDLKYLKSLELAKALQNEGYFMSESEDLDDRIQQYSSDHSRLNAMWDAAIVEATEIKDPMKGFEHLCSKLEIKNIESHPAVIPSPITWRFNMIPYGNEDATTFPVPSHEEPHRAFSLNFTYNNLGYNWGDYIDRVDNKGTPMRPSRQMFADVYIPGTK